MEKLCSSSKMSLRSPSPSMQCPTPPGVVPVGKCVSAEVDADGCGASGRRRRSGSNVPQASGANAGRRRDSSVSAATTLAGLYTPSPCRAARAKRPRPSEDDVQGSSPCTHAPVAVVPFLVARNLQAEFDAVADTDTDPDIDMDVYAADSPTPSPVHLPLSSSRPAAAMARTAACTDDEVDDDDDDDMLCGKQQRRFRDAFRARWNWDPVLDRPLDGAWRWEPIVAHPATSPAIV